MGAIGPGGGHHYGLAQVNLETGEREWEYSVIQEGMMYVLSGLSPDISLILGTERGMTGTGSRASILDVETGEQHYFLEDYTIYQSEWISDDERLYLLGVANGEVHYLKTADDASLWVWQTKELESEYE